MLVLIARSLAVYGGTAALLLYLAHRCVLRTRLSVCLLIAAAPLLFTGKAVLTGGVYAPLDIQYHHEPFASVRYAAGMTRVQTPLLSDVVYSMIPWQKAVRESVRTGHAPLWNRFVLAGEPLLAVQQPAALHPFTWLGFLLPLGQAWTFQMSARLLLAILCAYLLFRDMGCRDTAALLGALGWGFADFLMFWVGYPVGNAIGPFPLLLLGLSRLLRDGDRRAVALTVVALLLIVTAGHPETLLFAVTGAGVYFLFLLARAGSGRRGRPLLLSLLAGVLTLGLAAVQLMPLSEALPQTWEHGFRSAWFAHIEKSVSPRESGLRAVTTLVPFAHGESGHGQLRPTFGVPGAYVGALLLPFAFAGLLSRDRRPWPLLALGLLGLFLWARLRLVTDAVAKLPLFDIAITDYLVFLAAFATCGLAALGADRLADGEGRRAFLLGTVLSLFGIGGLFLWLEPAMRQLDMSEAFLRRRLLLELLPLGVGLLFLAARRPQGTRAALAAVLILFAAMRRLEAGEVYPTCPARAFAPYLAVLDGIPRGTPDRIVGKGFTLIPNAAALYELEDARGYESMTFRPLYETFPLWSSSQGAWFNRVDDLERPFLSFLNVRYALVPAGEPVPSGWTWKARGGGTDLLENGRALPRAFVPGWIRSEQDAARRLALLQTVSDFGERGVLGVSEDAPAAEWTRNGQARVVIRSYRAQGISLEVDAEDDALIGTSIVAWPGWKAKLDGGSVIPLSYNHAFLAFRVPAGRHRIDLRYLPDSVLFGAALSLLTLAASAVAWRAARPRPGATPVLSSPVPR